MSSGGGVTTLVAQVLPEMGYIKLVVFPRVILQVSGIFRYVAALAAGVEPFILAPAVYLLHIKKPMDK